MTWIRLLVILTILSWLYWLVAIGCVLAFFGRRLPEASARAGEPVSVLKPLCGLDPYLYENLASFVWQDYPEFELLFGVTDPQDPALAIIQQLQHDHPDRPIHAIVAPRVGANDKVSVLCALAAQAQYDLLVLADSDMRATPDYLQRMVAPLANPQVGLVTCLYRAGQPESLSAILEALYIGATFLPSVLVARRYLRMGFALGASCALRRADLEAIGGFEALRNYLADDYQLGARMAASGRQVCLVDYCLTSVLGRTRWSDQWHREVRWARCTRASRPLEYPALLLTFSTPLALLAAAALGFSTPGCAMLAISLLLRAWVARVVADCIGDSLLRASWVWLPLRDLLTLAVWGAALVGRSVNWRGRRFLLRRGGRLEEMIQTFAPRPWHRPAP